MAAPGASPSSSLKPADRIRAREQTGTEQLPAGLKVPFDQAQADIQRAAQFLAGGRITPEEYAARCRKIKERFDSLGRQALQERGERAVTAVLDRLKQRLDEAGMLPQNGSTQAPRPATSAL